MRLQKSSTTEMKMTWLSAVLLLLVMTFPDPAASVFTYENDKSGIVELHSPEIFEYLKYSPTAWIVEFYTPWCGRCQEFSDVWRKLANVTSGWRKVIRIGAMNCNDEPNKSVCRKSKVLIFPSVKLFPPGVENGFDHAVDLPDAMAMNEDELSQTIMDFASQVRVAYNRTDFPYLGVSDGQQALSEICHSRIIIFEDPMNPDPKVVNMGKRVILEASQGPGLKAHRVWVNDPIALKYGVSVAPSVVICVNEKLCKRLDAKSSSPSDILQELMHWTVQNGLPPQRWALETCSGESLYGQPEDRTLSVPLIPPNVGSQSSMSTSSSPPTTDIDAPSQPVKIQRRVYLKDLDNAVAVALRNEVSTFPVLDGERLSALKNFVAVLLQHYPGKPKTVDAIESVLHWITSHDGSISMVDWRAFLEYLDTKEDRLLPKEGRYVGCRGSKLGLRGYPCGLWMLFHTLVMEAHEKEDGDPVEVLRAMHGYINNFFGCGACKEHFDKMAEEDGLFGITDRTEAVMWLWRAHNKVNDRLAGNPLTEDPEHPKKPFPPAELCPTCFTDVRIIPTLDQMGFSNPTYTHVMPGGETTPTTVTAFKGGNVHIMWDDAEVLDFLRWFYVLTDDPLVINVRTNVSEEQRREAFEKWPSLKGRRKADSASDRADDESFSAATSTNSSANYRMPYIQRRGGLSGTSFMALLVIIFTSTILVLSIPNV